MVTDKVHNVPYIFNAPENGFVFGQDQDSHGGSF